MLPDAELIACFYYCNMIVLMTFPLLFYKAEEKLS